MNKCLIVFASFATAKRVKTQIYKKFNISSQIIQTPSQINAKGCSYSLKISSADADIVWEYVTKNALYTKGIFSDGDFKKIRQQI